MNYFLEELYIDDRTLKSVGMNKSLFHVLRIVALWGIILLFAGCAKNSVIYEIGNNTGKNDGTNSGSQEEEALITFNASIEGRNMSRSMSPMKKGIQSRLFAFQAEDGTPAVTPFEQGLYETVSLGVLSGVNGFKMYLPNDIYNFYAVSDNFSTIPPRFTSGQSEPLFNGIDYLWWESVQQDITSSQVNIPIVFLHAASQVVIEISEGQGVKLDRIVSAMITPPEPGATMNLTTGEIKPATTYGKADKMGINGSTVQYIMLPLSTSVPMKFTFDALVTGETATRTYTADVPLPDNELKAGNSYLFSAIIDGNALSFSTVNVKDWTEVDESGNPLYPIQK